MLSPISVKMTQAWLDAGNHKVNLKDIDQIEFL